MRPFDRDAVTRRLAEKLLHRHPAPFVRRHRQQRGVCFGRLLTPVPAPSTAAFGEDAFEEDGGGFGVGVLRPLVLREFALDRCLEDGGTIPLQVGSHPLQCDDPGIEVGEKLLDHGDDAALLFLRSDRQRH